MIVLQSVDTVPFHMLYGNLSEMVRPEIVPWLYLVGAEVVTCAPVCITDVSPFQSPVISHDVLEELDCEYKIQPPCPPKLRLKSVV